MMFHVGQKVVCVNDVPTNPRLRPARAFIKRGNIYEIRWIGSCPFEPWRDYDPFVRLVGIHRNGDHEYPDFPFAGFRFRPVKTTSIEIFQKMLVPSPREKANS